MGMDHWKKAIEKEMSDIEVDLKFMGEEYHIPIGYKNIHCHMIFDFEFDLTRKERFVSGRHMCNPPECMIYSSVVSR